MGADVGLLQNASIGTENCLDADKRNQMLGGGSPDHSVARRRRIVMEGSDDAGRSTQAS
jgi:hypothetical protein